MDGVIGLWICMMAQESRSESYCERGFSGEGLIEIIQLEVP